MARYFIAGTDTEIGKTTIAAGLLHAAAKAGFSTLGAKPVASGCERTPDGLRNEDALALLGQSTLQLPYAAINPYAFEPPIAPHLAAQEAGVALTVQALAQPMRQVLAHGAGFTLIEGAGGWRVPLAEGEYLSGLAVALALPVILVVGVRLGCINHALLTAEAIAADGLVLAGWVANVVDAVTSRLEENLATLTERLPAPCLGRVPRLASAAPEQVARYLDLRPLGLPPAALPPDGAGEATGLALK
ncbi:MULTISPECIES: dethiobiotin synthase [unclassified Pseudomonas]|uniref:dethiobiotin synthase n=1 Tax=unclassified Pseudomonas TaxID=196821 RepID=UPI000BD17E8B|nr:MULTISPECIES: dethiobiotin synthase [unclassified Pseudomonas]PVZ15691.1 dethiobiotin synthetase [Pseudomonas sp. URIL14HWK12:I12]PVZ25065.1 dethiobiotin synthetase [Pseudomonas sp. URIL14HWK12:I10]PVZ34911.1 dethiobiotin synthetase [Pseudomonas sp. URIL14HWK12:I11]SNZ09640.1 dethiobiotin synthetase [Pseudomonas sp. URIL14HWK12:I9]